MNEVSFHFFYELLIGNLYSHQANFLPDGNAALLAFSRHISLSKRKGKRSDAAV